MQLSAYLTRNNTKSPASLPPLHISRLYLLLLYILLIYQCNHHLRVVMCRPWCPVLGPVLQATLHFLRTRGLGVGSVATGRVISIQYTYCQE